jgi:hypothetical protein
VQVAQLQLEEEETRKVIAEGRRRTEEAADAREQEYRMAVQAAIAMKAKQDKELAKQ